MHSNEGRMTVTLTDIQREQGAIRRWQADVAEATLPFERRWTLAALKRVDPDIHRRLIAQRSLLDQALVTGTPEEIELHGAALCRGYAKAIQVQGWSPPRAPKRLPAAFPDNAASPEYWGSG